MTADVKKMSYFTFKIIIINTIIIIFLCNCCNSVVTTTTKKPITTTTKKPITTTKATTTTPAPPVLCTSCGMRGVCTSTLLSCLCVPGMYSQDGSKIPNCNKVILNCGVTTTKLIYTHCIDFPGGYILFCKEGYTGFNCDVERSQQVDNPIVLFNGTVKYGDIQFVIIFFENLPDLEMRLDVYTIDNFTIKAQYPFSSMLPGRFSITNDLIQLAAKNSITEVGDYLKNITFPIKGYYTIIRYRVVSAILDEQGLFKFSVVLTYIHDNFQYGKSDFGVLAYSYPLANGLITAPIS